MPDSHYSRKHTDLVQHNNLGAPKKRWPVPFAQWIKSLLTIPSAIAIVFLSVLCMNTVQALDNQENFYDSTKLSAPAQIEGKAGATLPIELKLFNGSTEEDTYTLDVTGGTASISKSEVKVETKKTITLTLNVTLPNTPRASDTITITATSQKNSSVVQATTEVRVSVAIDDGDEPELPTASFTASPLSGDASLTVHLNASASKGNGISYYWTSSDKQTLSGEKTQITFKQPGTYTIELTVVDTNKKSSTKVQKTVIVTDVLPTASFTASPLSGDASLTVHLNASASKGNGISYYWTSSDKQTLSGEKTQITFKQPGTYTIELTVVDTNEKSSTKVQKTVTVNSFPSNLIYITSTNDLRVVPLIKDDLPDLSQGKDLNFSASCHRNSEETLYNVYPLSNGGFFVILRNGNEACYSRFTPDGKGNFTEKFIGNWDMLSVGWPLSPTDLNGDQLDDLILINQTNTTNSRGDVASRDWDYQVALGKSDGSFKLIGRLVRFVENQWDNSRTVADADNDGHADFVFHTFSNGGRETTELYMLKGQGDGTFATNKTLLLDSPHGARTVVIADFNEDGYPDIFLPPDDDVSDEGQSHIAFGIGNGKFGNVNESIDFVLSDEERTHDTFYANAEAYDVNLDGHLDLVVRERFIIEKSTETRVYWGNGKGEFGTICYECGGMTTGEGEELLSPEGISDHRIIWLKHKRHKRHNIPTLSEWGLIIFILMLTTIGILFTMRRQAMIAATSGGIAEGTPPPVLVPAVFIKALTITGLLALIGFAIGIWLSSSLPTTTDIVGTLISVPIFAYLIHLLMIFKRQ